MAKPRSATPRIRVDAALAPAGAQAGLDQLRADLSLAARSGAGRLMLSDAVATVPAQQLVLAALDWAAGQGLALSTNPAATALAAMRPAATHPAAPATGA